jgi:hypothetical protein
VTLVVIEGGGRSSAEIEELKRGARYDRETLTGLQRKLLEEESTRKWAEAEIVRRDKVVASLFLEQEERKLLSNRYQAAGAYRSKCSKDLEGVAKYVAKLNVSLASALLSP